MANELPKIFKKGTYAAYTKNKSTLSTDGSIFICTDEPLLCAWGQEIGLSNTNKARLDALYEAVLGDEDSMKSVAEQIEEALDGILGDSDYESFDDIQDAIEAAVAKITALNYNTASNGIVTGVTQTEGKIAATSVAVGNGLEIAAEKLQVKLAEANKVLSNSADGLTATLSLDFASNGTTSGNTGNAVIQLKGVDGVVISEMSAENFLMDRVLDSVELSGSKLTFTFKVEHGTDASLVPIEVDLANYIKVYTEGNGIKITNNVVSVEVKEGEKFLEATASGLTTKGLDVLAEKATSEETAGKVLTQTAEGLKWQETTVIKKDGEVVTELIIDEEEGSLISYETAEELFLKKEDASETYATKEELKNIDLSNYYTKAEVTSMFDWEEYE